MFTLITFFVHLVNQFLKTLDSVDSSHVRFISDVAHGVRENILTFDWAGIIRDSNVSKVCRSPIV
jgi:hypothetical protein